MYKVSKAVYFLIAIVMIFGLMGPMVTMPKVVLAATLTINPTGQGNYNDFSKNGSQPTKWESVFDTSDSTYISNNSNNAKDTYTLNSTGLSGPCLTIESVTVHARAQQASSNLKKMALMIRSGTTDVFSSDKNLGSSWSDEWNTWTTNPATGQAWTVSEVNNLQAGVRNASNNGGSQVSKIWVVVEYTTATQYNIEAIAGPGGSISPSGNVTVCRDANKSFSINPDPGYIVKEVEIDGHVVDMAADAHSPDRINCYEFLDVHANHTITAVFEGGWKAPTGYDSTAFDFTDPGNAFISDNQFAHAHETHPEKYQVYKNFGLTVPAGAVVSGIQVAVEGYHTGNDINTLKIALSWDGGKTWTENQTADPLSEISVFSEEYDICEITELVGSCCDLWDRTWSASDFSDTNFRVRVVAVESHDGDAFVTEDEHVVYLDCLNVRLCYDYVSISKTAVDLNGGVLAVGDTVRFTIEYSNDGTGEVGVRIMDTFNTADFSSIGNFAQVGGHFGTTPTQVATGLIWPSEFVGVILEPGDSGSVSYNAVISRAVGTISNTACIGSGTVENGASLQGGNGNGNGSSIIADVCDTVTLTLTQQIPMVILNKKSLLNDPNAMWSMPTIGGHVTYSYVRMSTQVAQVNQPVTVYANAANDGYEPIGYTAILKINGVVTGLKSGSLEPNQAKPLEFVITPTKPGNYEVDINGQRAFFSVMGQEVVVVAAPADNAPAAPAAAPVSETIAKDNTAKNATYVIFGVMVFLAVLLAILVIQKRRTSY